MNITEKDIIFFDGVCNLCDRFVNFVYLRDKEKIFFYAPLQGLTAKKLLREETEKLISIVYYKQGVLFRGTEAVSEILKTISVPWSWILKPFPSFVKGFFYNVIAQKRYKIFGKKDYLYTPSEEQKKFFLP